MSYPDPYHPQQQPPPRPYPPGPPAPSGPYGYGVPPNGGYPPAQPYGAQQQPPYYPPPAEAPQPAAKRSDGNSWGWQLVEALTDLASGSSSHGLGNSSRDRVKTVLIIWGIALVGIAILILVLVLISK